MNKYIKMLVAGTALILLLTGCGNQIPDMTEEQMQMVGEYAAITLLKYDADHRSRLVDMSVIEVHDAREKEIQEKMAQLQATIEPEGMKPVEETPTMEAGQGTENSSSGIRLEEFYNFPEGMNIIYQGEEICDSYSGDASVDAFSLDATQGKKLLLLKFEITNQTGNNQQIELFSKSTVYRVTINESYSKNALTTMLTDDMSTYMGTVSAGESKEVVLIAEIDKNSAETITSVSLNFKNESKAGTIRLK